MCVLALALGKDGAREGWGETWRGWARETRGARVKEGEGEGDRAREREGRETTRGEGEGYLEYRGHERLLARGRPSE